MGIGAPYVHKSDIVVPHGGDSGIGLASHGGEGREQEDDLA